MEELCHHSLLAPWLEWKWGRQGMKPRACSHHPLMPTNPRGPEKSRLFFTPKECHEALKPED